MFSLFVPGVIRKQECVGFQNSYNTKTFLIRPLISLKKNVNPISTLFGTGINISWPVLTPGIVRYLEMWLMQPMTKKYQNWQRRYSKSGKGDFFTHYKI